MQDNQKNILLEFTTVRSYDKQTKSYSFLSLQKQMSKDEIFFIVLFTLSLIINKCLTNKKFYSHGNSCLTH